MSNLMKIRPVGTELFHVDGRTDGRDRRTDRRKDGQTDRQTDSALTYNSNINSYEPWLFVKINPSPDCRFVWLIQTSENFFSD